MEHQREPGGIMKTLAILVLLTVAVSAANAQTHQDFKGTCNGSISESDGVLRAQPNMPGAQFAALMKQARESHRTIGSDGFLWSQRPFNCDSADVVDVGDKGHTTAVRFSNGFILSGGRGDDPSSTMFSVNAFNSGSGSDVPVDSQGRPGCMFMFNYAVRGPAMFSSGWATNLTFISCTLNFKGDDGRIVSLKVDFKSQGPAQ
jgi:hypothetical protein